MGRNGGLSTAASHCTWSLACGLAEMTMADMGTLHSKGGQQVLSSYMHYGSTVLVGTQCDTSYTEHRTQSNHQPLNSSSGAAGGRPMSCPQLLRANSRRRQWKNRHNTVRASRLTRAEALLSLAVLKMYGKWFGRRTRVGSLYW